MPILRTLQGKMSKVTAERSAEGRKYSVTYLVETTTQIDGPWEVLELSGLPPIGQRFEFGVEFDNYSLLKRKAARMLSNETEHWWEVTCEYEPYDSKTEDDKPVNPEDEPPEVEVGFAQFTRHAESARFLGLNTPDGPQALGPVEHPFLVRLDSGRPINSSGEIYDPGIEIDDSRLTVRIIRNELKLDADIFRKINSINADEFTIKSGGLNLFCRRSEAKMQSIQAQVSSKMIDVAGQSVQQTYWRISYEIGIRRTDAVDMLIPGGSVRRTGWHVAALDAGFSQALEPGDDDGRGGEIAAEEIQPLNPRVAAQLESLDARGGHYSSAQPLDGHGKLLGRIPAEGKRRLPMVYSLWQVYPYMFFGTFKF